MVSAVSPLNHAYMSAAGAGKTWKIFYKDLSRNTFPQFVSPAINILCSV